MLVYTQNYEEATSQYGQSTGRTGTTLLVINNSIGDAGSILFGNGYSSTKEDNAQTTFGIRYGIVGFIRDIITGGWIVMFLVFIIISKIRKKNLS